MAQLASKYTLHYFDLDNGISRFFACVPQEYWGNVKVYSIKSTPEEPNGLKTLDLALRLKAKTPICIAHGRAGLCPTCGQEKPGAPEDAKYQVFDTSNLTCKDIVVVDTATTLCRDAYNVGNGVVNPSAVIDYEKKDLKSFDRSGFYLDNFLLRMKNLPCHKLLVCHAIHVENPNGVKEMVPMVGTRNFSLKALGDFGHKIYTFIKVGQWSVASHKKQAPGANVGSRFDIVFKENKDIFKFFEPPGLEDMRKLGAAVSFKEGEVPDNSVVPKTAV